MKEMRSMRDIPTIQGLRHRMLPSTREQVVGELARLEHEKARLQREMAMWLQKQQKTESMLAQIEERLVRLQQMLEPTVSGPATVSDRARIRGKKAVETNTAGDETGSSREIILEY